MYIQGLFTLSSCLGGLGRLDSMNYFAGWHFPGAFRPSANIKTSGDLQMPDFSNWLRTEVHRQKDLQHTAVCVR